MSVNGQVNEHEASYTRDESHIHPQTAVYAHQQQQWGPPAPSLQSLPIDRSKTDPKPAYYKLQFGDDFTGFSYYVRTLSVIIGRNCEKAVPPPVITDPSVPQIPPLEHVGQNSIVTTPPIVSDAILTTPPVADFPSPPLPPLSATLPRSALASTSLLPEQSLVKTEARADTAEPELRDSSAANLSGLTGMEGGFDSIPPELLAANMSDLVALASDAELQTPTQIGQFDLVKSEPQEAFGSAQIGGLDQGDYFGVDYDVPPPPPSKTSAPVDSVDVDLGPLKSVSRNHAKIEYRDDIGHFCLEICGRNGVWVNDRYYVKGSTVPLYQGSQIQIATRIFSFILPPSADPSYSPYSLEDTSNSLEDVPYPYNLPPGQVGYNEFYGEPGPGPSSSANIAARQVPTPFNAFAADGFGLGIEGAEGKRFWDDEWDSDSDNRGEGDSDSMSGGEEDDGEEGSNGPAGSQTKLKLKLKKGSEVPEDQAMSGKKALGNGRKNSKDDVIIPIEDPSRGKGAGKTASKKKKGKKDEDDAMDVEVIDVSAQTPSEAGTQTTPNKAKKKSEEKPTQGKKEPLKKKKASLSSATPAPAVKQEIKPAPTAPPPVQTLAQVMKETTPVVSTPTPAPSAKPPATAAQVKPIQAKSIPPPGPTTPMPKPTPAIRPQGANTAPTQGPVHGPAPRPVGPPGAPVPPHLQRAASASTPASPASSAGNAPNLGRANSASTNGPAEPQRPFYLTELKETPGRPGHIVVNVPIPPSGAGPRPPPGPLIGLDGKTFIGPPPLKPTATFATIIHRALLYLPRGRGTLGEVCNWVAGEWEWFRLNIDAGWQNSIRHNLSLNKAFLKVPRIPEDDPESKGSVWIIDPEEGPLFEEKQRKDAMKSMGKDKTMENKRERDRIKTEERQRKARDMAMEAAQAQANLAKMANSGQVQPMLQPAQQPLPVNRPMGPAPQPIRQNVQPHPRPVIQRAQAATTGISANSKGLLAPKGKITVSIQTLTPAHRAKSVISTTDAAGNPLPFACDGTTLTLDQATFGHLTGDIIDKLTLLGAAGAVDVLSAWVINKNKNQAARAAAAAQAQGTSGQPPKPTAASIKAGLTANANRPQGASASISPNPPPGTIQPKPAPVATKPPGAQPTAASTAGKPVGPTGKPLPGPAPPGASLTKVIGMIAEVANAKGDVNTVGPNASALLRYIRVVGVDIDLRVAERIWATGIVPPLPAKKGVPPGGAKPNGGKPMPTAAGSTPQTKPATSSTLVPAVVKPGVATSNPAPKPAVSGTPAPIAKAPAPAPAPAPARPLAPPVQVPATQPAAKVQTAVPAVSATGGVKRKLEEEPGEEVKKARVEATS